MRHISIDHFSAQYSIEFESQAVDEISEDTECTIVVKTEREENLRSANCNLLGRFLYNGFRVSPLIVLSMLGSATGLEDDYYGIASYSCFVVADMCKIIAIDKMAGNNRDYFNFTRNSFIYSSETTEEYNRKLIEGGNKAVIDKYTRKDAFNLTLPLVLPSKLPIDDSRKEDLFNQLFYIDKWIVLETRKYYGELCEKIYHLSKIRFCRFGNPDASVFNRFCSDIRSYVAHPGLSSVTAKLNNTIMVDPTLATTEVVPTDKDDVTFFIALVTFIFFTVSIFLFMGYKICKASKSRQTISQVDNVNAKEERKNIV
ncbi:hypothetical protein [Candidatus Ichthyocystis sparus]|uniref:hypothetical protein n=1 Tax=Candidatus Ichthyocystis sparus TaxID=1561004 RepID=UPI000B84D481|nr:hypothetical protein [Candidatus Ichthyocystis sparus]